MAFPRKLSFARFMAIESFPSVTEATHQADKSPSLTKYVLRVTMSFIRFTGERFLADLDEEIARVPGATS